MKKILFIISAVILIIIKVFSQSGSIQLTFTAVNNEDYVKLDSIKIINKSLYCDTVLHYPDTLIILDYEVGIIESENENLSLKVFQNYPNPVNEMTTISLSVPEKNLVSMIIQDVFGQVIIKRESILERGYHSFQFVPGGSNLYFYTARWRGEDRTIKIISSVSGSNMNASLEYVGIDKSTAHLKGAQAIQSFPFNLGDDLLFIGFANTLQSGILDSPETSEFYSLQFATNLPCPGTPTVTYGGQVYNTNQIFSQCWLKENLNVGLMIPASQNMTNNGLIEKYCFYNDEDTCTKYGGLYQWEEMMKYDIFPGIQGICPPGWHIPDEADWKTLEGAVDSQYGIANAIWNNWGYRGYDAGVNLKSTSGWFEGSNGTDQFGFSGLPAGSRSSDGVFYLEIGIYSFWWTSRDDLGGYNSAWCHHLDYVHENIGRDSYSFSNGFSVRCIKNY